ncbi:MAG: response regulator transcription factor [Lachnospiraceae bacterium]|nr:response regulator transcription factor [Lachnospiraceae bacterium]
MRLLFAEDEADLNHIVTKRLTEEGYSVDACFDGEEAIDCLDAADYDAVILDIMMPKADGFTVLKHLRDMKKTTPVLFLTARDAVTDRVRGLDMGANDYLVKPFAFDELKARIRAMTRTVFREADTLLEVGNLQMDVAAHVVKRGDRVIDLSAKEYALLEYLMHNAGTVLSREKIEDHIWNFDYEGGTNVVDVYISYLRKKIDAEGEDKLIHTVRGAGYVLRA